MANNTMTLERNMTRVEFDAVVENTFKVLDASGMGQDKEKLAEDLLDRFAQKHGLTREEAIESLDRDPEPETEPELPTPEPPRKKRSMKEAAESIREMEAKGTYFYEAPEDAAKFDATIALNRDAGLPANLLVTGASGIGKTEGIKYGAERHGLAFHKIDCASINSEEKWLGHKEFDPKEGTKFVLSEFLKAVTGTDCTAGVVLLDELNRLHPRLHNILFPLLDGSKSVWVPELGITVHKHPDTIFVATANKGVGYTGTHKMDDALEGRFPMRMEKVFPSASEEVTILTKRTGLDARDAKMLVSIAGETRAKAANDDLPFAVSTRDLLWAAALVAAGMPIPQAADWTFVAYYDAAGGASSPRAMVKQIVQGKTVGK